MKDESLIADLIRAGLSPDLVGRVVVELVSRNVPQMSGTIGDNVPDTRDTKSEYERRRKADWRLKTKGRAKANDVAQTALPSQNVPDNVPDNGDICCNLLPSSLIEKPLKNKKVGIENARARGTRLVPGQQITEPDLAFAINAGMTASAARHAWVEFIDYWIAIPGQRGLKINWPATWRNRVRELIKRGINGSHQARPDKSAIAALDRLGDAFTAYGLCEENGQGTIVELPARRLR